MKDIKEIRYHYTHQKDARIEPAKHYRELAEQAVKEKKDKEEIEDMSDFVDRGNR